MLLTLFCLYGFISNKGHTNNTLQSLSAFLTWMTSGDYLVQSLCQGRLTNSRLQREASRWVFSVSREGDHIKCLCANGPRHGMKEGKERLTVLFIPSLHLEQENSKYGSFMYGTGCFYFWRHSY